MGSIKTNILITFYLLSMWNCIELTEVVAFSPHTNRLQRSCSLYATIATHGTKTVENVSKLPSNGNDSFQIIAELAASTLVRSDMRRDAKGEDSKPTGSSATNWIDDASSFALKQALNNIYLKVLIRLIED